MGEAIIYHHLGFQVEAFLLEQPSGPSSALARPLIPLRGGGTPTIGGLGEGTERAQLRPLLPGFPLPAGRFLLLMVGELCPQRQVCS